jgi:hypothetical protein
MHKRLGKATFIAKAVGQLKQRSLTPSDAENASLFKQLS